MHDYTVSIIIPSYNAEKTISRAIESVFFQTFTQSSFSLELICIDDGSEDHTVQIINSLKATHPQIRLFTQQHQGAGSARNLGIAVAKGKYISFLDADDTFVDPNALEEMVRACITHCSHICGSNRIISERGQDRKSRLFRGYEIPREGCYIAFIDFQYDYDYQSYIFERRFLLENNISFPPYMRYQDPPFFLRAMSLAKKFYVVPITLYRYTIATSKSNVLQKYIIDILKGILDTLLLSLQNGYHDLFKKIINRVDNEYRKAILYGMTDEVMSLLLEINSLSYEHTGKRIKVLHYIYEGAKEKHKYLFEKYLCLLHPHEDIVIYGANQMGKELKDKLEAAPYYMSIRCFVVKDPAENPSRIGDIRVVGVNEAANLKNEKVLVALDEKYIYDALDDLQEAGFSHLIPISSDSVFWR